MGKRKLLRDVERAATDLGLQRSPSGDIINNKENLAICKAYLNKKDQDQPMDEELENLLKEMQDSLDTGQATDLGWTLDGFVASISGEWPQNIPFPSMWRKHKRQKLFGHKGITADDAIAHVKKAFNGVKTPFKNENIAEAMADNYLFNRECRTFYFSKRLIAALRQTYDDRILAEFIKLPVPVVYFDFTERDGDFTYLVDGTKVGRPRQRITMRGCLLTIDGPNLVSIIICDMESDSPDDPPVIYGLVKTDITDKYVRFPVPESTEFPEIIKSFNIAATMLALNALLYVNSVNADLKEEWIAKGTVAKLKKTKGRRRHDLKKHLEEVGKATYAGYYLYIPSISEANGEEPETGRKVTKRFLCRGHFRHYWIGPHRGGERKRIQRWIAPHWKGPETADRVHEKVYLVRDRRPN